MGTRDFNEVKAELKNRIPDYEDRMAVKRRRLNFELLLAELREGAGITQTDLAKILGITQPRISKIESGGSDPKLSTVYDFLSGLGYRLSIEAIADNDDGETIRIPLIAEANPTTA